MVRHPVLSAFFLSLAMLGICFTIFNSLAQDGLVQKYAARASDTILKADSQYSEALSSGISQFPGLAKKYNIEFLQNGPENLRAIFVYDEFKILIDDSSKDLDSVQLRQLIHDELFKKLGTFRPFVTKTGQLLAIERRYAGAEGSATTVFLFTDPVFTAHALRIKKILLTGFFSFFLLFNICISAVFRILKKTTPRHNGEENIRGIHFKPLSTEIPADSIARKKSYNPEKNIFTTSADDKRELFLKEEFRNVPCATNPADGIAAVKPEIIKENNPANNKSTITPNSTPNEEKSLQTNTRSHGDVVKDYLKLKAEVDELSILREIHLAGSSITVADEFYKAMLELLQGQFNAAEIDLFIQHSSEKGVLYKCCSITGKGLFHYREKDEPVIRITVGIGPEGHALERLTEFIQPHMMLVPLIDKDTVTGAIRFTSKPEETYNDENRFVFRSVAKHIAASLNNIILYDRAVRDGLTGIFGHRHFKETIDEELKKACRYKDNLTLALIDLDHFKKLNDTYGHQAGDHVLKTFADSMKNTIRSTDVCFRYGGEEFSILFMRIDSNIAKEICDKLRALIHGMKISYMKQDISLSISIGISSLDNRNISPEQFIKEADRALYHAKENGRNRICIFDEI